jgi:uncharacterized protein (DUF1778 family)
MTDLVPQSLQAAAERAIARCATLILDSRESEAFARAILRPKAPGRVLRRAARDYRQKIRLTFSGGKFSEDANGGMR